MENETPAGPGGTQQGVSISGSLYLQGPSQYGNINKTITGSDNIPRSVGSDVLMITEQITDEMTLVVMNTSVLDGIDQSNFKNHENYIDNFLVRIIDTST